MAADLPEGFRPFVESLKAHIRDAQLRAALAVNRVLLALYWNIGRAIAERQEAEGWGARVIDQLADEIQRAFYLAYPAAQATEAIVPQAVGRARWETRLVASLPPELEGALPTVEQLEAELGAANTSEEDA